MSGAASSWPGNRGGQGSYEIRVVGAPRAIFRDLYHAFLQLSWARALGLLVAGYLLLNVGFAFAYAELGGVANARPGSLWDAFCFSIQTMGTIGYGAMYPTAVAANLLVMIQSVLGIVVTALSTGLVFAKFSLSTARIVFSRRAVVSLMDGVPTLMFRVGNERSNQIMEANVRVVMIRTELTAEGMTFYRMYDVPLARERSPAVSRSWTAMHPIKDNSPLFGHTPESLRRDEVELVVSLVGVDDTSFQPVHARKTYYDDEIVWGARLADVLREDPDGGLTLDLTQYHVLVPTPATKEFPYSATV